jgi:translation initiation factor IF-3
VPIPRKFDRRPPERDDTRINEMIRVPQVRLIGDDGNQIGVVSRDEALKYAQERDLDLVEVAAEARPPVCRVLDYSKYKYEQEQKQKAARRHQKQVHVREIKLRPKIATNDYETKKGHVRRFLDADNKVKVTIMFRGREMAHPERGEALLMRLADDVQDLGVIEQRPNQDGRNMTMMLGPVKKKEAPHPEGGQPASAEANGEAPTEAAAPAQAQAPADPPAAPPEQAKAPSADQAEAPAEKAEAPAPAEAGAKA